MQLLTFANGHFGIPKIIEYYTQDKDLFKYTNNILYVYTFISRCKLQTFGSGQGNLLWHPRRFTTKKITGWQQASQGTEAPRIQKGEQTQHDLHVPELLWSFQPLIAPYAHDSMIVDKHHWKSMCFIHSWQVWLAVEASAYQHPLR